MLSDVDTETQRAEREREKREKATLFACGVRNSKKIDFCSQKNVIRKRMFEIVYFLWLTR